jgi:hypothetical protein
MVPRRQTARTGRGVEQVVVRLRCKERKETGKPMSSHLPQLPPREAFCTLTTVSTGHACACTTYSDQAVGQGPEHLDKRLELRQGGGNGSHGQLERTLP